MRRNVVGLCVVALMFACCTLSLMATGDSKDEAQQSGYQLIQHHGSDYAGLFLTDKKSENTISIYNGKEGLFIAFYEHPDANKSRPQLAVSAKGIQIIGPDGKVRQIGLEELSKLDTD